MKTISNTEAGTAATCETQWYFSHYLKLRPKYDYASGAKLNGLQLGTIGHDILATFYKAMFDGKSYADATNVAKAALAEQLMLHSGEAAKQIMMLSVLIGRYISEVVVKDISEGYRPVMIEQDLYFGVNEDFRYGMRLDLLMQDRYGDLWLWDHKFLYNFYTTKQIKLGSQIPKYVSTLQANGYSVKGAKLNMLRTRWPTSQINSKPYDDVFRREPVLISDARANNTLRQQLRTSLKIVELRERADRGDTDFDKILNTFVCDHCPVASLCIASMEDRKIGPLAAVEYERNDYGYDSARSTDSL